MHVIESKAQPSPPEPTMRQERTVQVTIFEVFAGQEIGCELKAISQWLDRQRALASLVAGDLRRHGLHETGRRGLPAETVLRCALLKQQRQLSYEELAFHLGTRSRSGELDRRGKSGIPAYRGQDSTAER